MIYVILMEPENSANIGSVARVMKNFGQKNLVLINPKANHLSNESKCLAKHAQDILKKAVVTNKAFLKKMDYLVGTTAIISTDYNVSRSPINPESLAKIKGEVGLMLGREGKGLTNDEIRRCDLIVAIPASRKYPTLNISHACAILLYELFKRKKKNSVSGITRASGKDREILMKYLFNRIDSMKFATEDKRNTQKRVWKRVLNKAILTKREAFALIGFFKK